MKTCYGHKSQEINTHITDNLKKKCKNWCQMLYSNISSHSMEQFPSLHKSIIFCCCWQVKQRTRDLEVDIVIYSWYISIKSDICDNRMNMLSVQWESDNQTEFSKSAWWIFMPFWIIDKYNSRFLLNSNIQGFINLIHWVCLVVVFSEQ